jgi:hypothetical protein
VGKDDACDSTTASTTVKIAQVDDMDEDAIHQETCQGMKISSSVADYDFTHLKDGLEGFDTWSVPAWSYDEHHEHEAGDHNDDCGYTEYQQNDGYPMTSSSNGPSHQTWDECTETANSRRTSFGLSVPLALDQCAYPSSYPSTPISSTTYLPDSPYSTNTTTTLTTTTTKNTSIKAKSKSTARKYPISPYPNKSSHTRKLEAFRHVKKLILVDLPCKKTGVHLEAWAKPRSYTERGLLMPNVERYIMRSKAVYQLAEWSERHTGSLHPFATGLSYAVAPTIVCVTYPTMDDGVATRFCEKREQMERTMVRKKTVSEKMITRNVLMRWFLFQITGIDGVLGKLMGGWKISDLTIHDVVQQKIAYLGAQRIRIYFKGCGCVGKAGAKKGCIDHITSKGRMRRIAELLNRSRGNGESTSIELVDLGTVGDADLTVHEVRPFLGAEGATLEDMKSLIIPRGCKGDGKVDCTCCGEVGR